MTAQAPYESLTSVGAVQRAFTDGRAVEFRVPGTKWIRAVVDEPSCIGILLANGEYRAALPERAPVSAGGDADNFTDTSRAALAWVLYHHQGGSSPVGQPLRFALGMGAHEPLSEHQVSEAKRWALMTGSKTADFHATPAPPVGADWVMVPRGWAMRRHPNGSIEVSKDHHSFVVERDKSAFDARIWDFLDAMLAAAPAPAEARGVGGGDALLARAYEVVHHDTDCPAIGGNGDDDCRCDAVPFLRDLRAALAANKPDTRQAQAQGSEGVGNG